jgi:hypothetical protein
MLYQVIHPTNGWQKMDGNLFIPELRILVLDESQYKFDAVLAEGIAMLYKNLAVMHVMVGGAFLIRRPRLVLLSM